MHDFFVQNLECKQIPTAFFSPLFSPGKGCSGLRSIIFNYSTSSFLCSFTTPSGTSSLSLLVVTSANHTTDEELAYILMQITSLFCIQPCHDSRALAAALSGEHTQEIAGVNTAQGGQHRAEEGGGEGGRKKQ